MSASVVDPLHGLLIAIVLWEILHSRRLQPRLRITVGTRRAAAQFDAQLARGRTQLAAQRVTLGTEGPQCELFGSSSGGLGRTVFAASE